MFGIDWSALVWVGIVLIWTAALFVALGVVIVVGAVASLVRYLIG